MATSSITKKFIIKDRDAYSRFIKLQEEPFTEKPRTISNRLEEGNKKLKQFSFHLKG